MDLGVLYYTKCSQHFIGGIGSRIENSLAGFSGGFLFLYYANVSGTLEKSTRQFSNPEMEN